MQREHACIPPFSAKSSTICRFMLSSGKENAVHFQPNIWQKLQRQCCSIFFLFLDSWMLNLSCCICWISPVILGLCDFGLNVVNLQSKWSFSGSSPLSSLNFLPTASCVIWKNKGRRSRRRGKKNKTREKGVRSLRSKLNFFGARIL